MMQLVCIFLHNQPVRESPRLPKGTGFSRISIKRVSGVLSSSFKLPGSTANEPNAVFYTGMSIDCFSCYYIRQCNVLCRHGSLLVKHAGLWIKRSGFKP